METLRLKPRQPVEDAVENWDDDDFLIEGDDITIHSQQSASGHLQTSRRDSHSSFRSDFESIHGDEEKHVHLPGDDEKSTLDAIAAATRAGIPIPKNVPPSALMGGTIKRLGGRKIKQIIQEDWDDDLELPSAGELLKIKPQDGSKFPDVLRQVSSSTNPSPMKPTKPLLFTTTTEGFETKPIDMVKPSLPRSSINLDLFRDDEDDDDFFGDGSATIKVSKRRDPPKPVSLITPPTPQKPADMDDDFEIDFELPSDGKLKLSSRREIPKTPSMNTLDDLEWAEGSLGTRFGGTRRDGRSNRSSSASALSPSVASSITQESEDDAFDGLVLPEGPVDFGERLTHKRKSRSPERASLGPAKVPEKAPPKSPPKSAKLPQAEADREDFFTGLDVGDGDVFGSKKLTLHRNIQIKETRPASPSRPKTTVALKFTNKPVVASRLPRPMGSHASHERTHTQSSLEPVSESGGPIPPSRRSLSRLGHSAQSSVTSLPTPTTPSSTSSIPPSTPRRREITSRASNLSLRNEPTTTSAQLLRLKRSLPAMKPNETPARPLTSRAYERPPSRTELQPRPLSSMRPKTPVERTRATESASAQARKPAPFLPAGSGQSHNVNSKSSRVFRRHDSDNSIDFRPNSRAVSRSTMRSPSPRKHRPADKLASDGVWRQLSKPRRVKHFGDGNELDAFDDLPTSSHAEAKFIRQPTNAGAKAPMRNKIYQNILPDRTNTPSPAPYSPARVDYVPSFARDTAASRIARETSLAQRAPSTGPLAPLTTQRVAQLSARSNLNPHMPQSSVRSMKTKKPLQLKPHLISNLNPPKESKGEF